MRKNSCLIGVSDHTLGSVVPVTSISHGAVMIEKYLKFDDKSLSADARFSLGPDNFKKWLMK